MRTEDEVIKQLKDRCELHIKMKESGDDVGRIIASATIYALNWVLGPEALDSCAGFMINEVVEHQGPTSRRLKAMKTKANNVEASVN